MGRRRSGRHPQAKRPGSARTNVAGNTRSSHSGAWIDSAAARWVTFGSGIMAIGISLFGAWAGCRDRLEERISRQAAEEKQLTKAVRSSFGADIQAVPSMQDIRKWASKHRSDLHSLIKLSPKHDKQPFSPKFENQLQRLTERWLHEVGEPTPAAHNACLEIDRSLQFLESAHRDGLIRIDSIADNLEPELDRFADDLAPRCAVVLASSAENRVLFTAGFFFPEEGKQFSDDPYKATTRPKVDLSILQARRVRRHPQKRSRTQYLDLPALTFSGCNGTIRSLDPEAAPDFTTGRVAFDFTPGWPRSGPGTNLLCALLGSTEEGFLHTGDRFEIRQAPPVGRDWISLEFNADGSGLATFFSVHEGIPVAALVPPGLFGDGLASRISIEWDSTGLSPNDILKLTVDDIEAKGSFGSPGMLTDRRRTPYGGRLAAGDPTTFVCDVRVREGTAAALEAQGAPVPQCFVRSDGVQRRYARCRMPARRELRYGRLWTFIEGLPDGADILTDTCIEFDAGGNWEPEALRCRIGPADGRDCWRLLPDGTMAPATTDDIFPAVEAIGPACQPAPCIVFFGDRAEAEP